jgi:acetolactate synthase-1/3 small subunit
MCDSAADVTLIVLVHDRPGALAKIAGVFHRRGVNIGSLTVSPAAGLELATVRMRVAAPRVRVERMALAIGNLVDVVSVDLAEGGHR